MDVLENTMSADLTLDPSDPLNMLMHGNDSNDCSSQDDSSRGASPPDWSLSSLWSSNPYLDSTMNCTAGFKYPDLALDYNALPLEMDFNPSMSVDPSALHYDPRGAYTNPPFSPNMPVYTPTHSHTIPQELLSAGFPFTFTPTPMSNEMKPRRLSITSSSSSSGASLSPVIEPRQSTPSTDSRSSVGDLADELAERVRQSAGVMLAVSANLQGQQSAVPSPQMTKVAIPRLQKQAKATIRGNKRQGTTTAVTKSSVPSSTSSSPGPESANPTTTHTLVMTRPKTSHTTIERRYRTNLNARIQSLRAAVPALRVLEDKTRGTNSYGDIVDERGFVDGVKVARKGSKATVLGKAVEYIRVLKKREARLKREQKGLKSLLCGLVGGPALLKEWEREWLEKFGGEEKDEVEGEDEDDAEAKSENEDDDGDDDDDGEDEDGARSRKKVRMGREVRKEKKLDGTEDTNVAPASLFQVVPEKRKRGRPKKQQPSLELSDVSLSSPSSNRGQGQGQVQQYLLATFALFSFFNSPLTSPSSTPAPAHTHAGVVLGHSHIDSMPTMVQDVYGWKGAVQMFHLLVSALVFLSIVLPWLPIPNKWQRTRTLIPSFLSVPISLLKSNSSGVDSRQGPNRGMAERGLLSGAGARLRIIFGDLDKKEWMRLRHNVALDDSPSLLTRLQTFWYMSAHASSTADLATLALVVRPLSSGRATQLWARAARGAERVRPYERLILEKMTVDEAAERLKASKHERGEERMPLEVLARAVLLERMRRHAAILFLRAVMGDEERDKDEDQDKEEKERQMSIDAAKSLGGQIAELAESLESAWKCGAYDIDGAGLDLVDTGAEGAVGALLASLALYRGLFPARCMAAQVLSPPPSPGGDDSVRRREKRMALRRALGAEVFECKGGDEWWARVEDARDKVVDMLVEGERGVLA